MSPAVFSLLLLDGLAVRRIDDATSLVAADASGQFGILPGHEPLVTVLEAGLFRYRRASLPDWTHGACVGGALRCARVAGRTEVSIVSARILQDAEPEALQTRLEQALQRESIWRVSTRESRQRIDTALWRRLKRLGQEEPA